MNARLVRKTLGCYKALTMLEVSFAWEDVVYNLTRSAKTLRIEAISQMQCRWISVHLQWAQTLLTLSGQFVGYL